MATLKIVLYLSVLLGVCAVPVLLAWWIVRSPVRLKRFHLWVTVPLIGFMVVFLLIWKWRLLLAAAVATIDYVFGLLRGMPFLSVLIVVLLFLIWRSIEKLSRLKENH